jgi:hypothetical protein
MVTKAISKLFKKTMVIDKDFDIDPDHNNENDGRMVALKILTGKYKGVSFRFGKVSVADKENADGTYTIDFDYDIITPGKHDPNKLRDNQKFTDTLGAILNAIIIAGIEREAKEHEETGDNHIEEPDTKRRVRKKGSTVSK